MELRFQVSGKIRKPVAEVFDAVYDPKQLSGYFTTGGASAPLDEGTTVTWDFHDYPGAFPVYVKEVVHNERIVFEWQAQDRDYNTRVEMTFKPIEGNATLVEIRESGWQPNQQDLNRSYGNCFGWSQMLCCLKVYVEHGINLREFFF